MANCPKCGSSISELRVKGVIAKGDGVSLKSAIYSCPSCDTVISAVVDPYALVAEVKKARR